MKKRPDLPKRLAAQIRAAQRRVADARESLSNNIRSRKQAELEVEEYDADPEAFAARYYPGKGVDSYPVMTRIERRREALAYYTGRFDHKVEMIVEAESELLELEQDILMQVLTMRLTKGREPWPKPLSAHYISDVEAEVKAERGRHARLFDLRRRKLQLEAELEDAALREESDREADAANAEYDDWFRSQPPTSKTVSVLKIKQSVMRYEKGASRSSTSSNTTRAVERPPFTRRLGTDTCGMRGVNVAGHSSGHLAP